MNGTINDFVAGSFTAKYSLNSIASGGSASYFPIGRTREGWHLATNFHEQEIHADDTGEGIADTVNQGTDTRVEGILLSIALFKTASKSPLWVQNAAEGQSNQRVGLLGSTYYGTLVLTPVAGTSAEALIGAGNSYVFYLAAIGNDVSQLLGSKAREIQVSFRTLPDPTHSMDFYTITTTP